MNGKENRTDDATEKVRRHKLAMKTLVSGGGGKKKVGQTAPETDARLMITEEAPATPHLCY